MSQSDLDAIKVKRAYKRQWYIDNRSRLLAKAKANFEANPERVRERSREIARRDPERNRSKVTEWRQANPERAKNSELKKNYGITLEDYIKIFESQGKCCAICKSDSSGSKNDWHVDHCHATGKVRGVLCHHCNRGLGGFKDSIAALQVAINYLQQ